MKYYSVLLSFLTLSCLLFSANVIKSQSLAREPLYLKLGNRLELDSAALNADSILCDNALIERHSNSSFIIISPKKVGPLKLRFYTANKDSFALYYDVDSFDLIKPGMYHRYGTFKLSLAALPEGSVSAYPNADIHISCGIKSTIHSYRLAWLRGNDTLGQWENNSPKLSSNIKEELLGARTNDKIVFYDIHGAYIYRNTRDLGGFTVVLP